MDYVVEAAVDGDDLVQEISEFFVNNPEKGIRQLPPDEVQQLSEDGLFFVARIEDTNEIVATVYFQADGADAWEMGGALVATPHRQGGIFRCLAVACLVAQYLQDRVSASTQGAKKVIGRVLKGNKAPIGTLKSLHFVHQRDFEIDPAGKVGVQDMPTNAHGKVEASEWLLDETYVVKLVEEAIEYRDNQKLPRSGKTVRIEIPYLLEDEGDDPLKDLLSELNRAPAPP